MKVNPKPADKQALIDGGGNHDRNGRHNDTMLTPGS